MTKTKRKNSDSNTISTETYWKTFNKNMKFNHVNEV